jgi:hypothetical protein
MLTIKDHFFKLASLLILYTVYSTQSRGLHILHNTKQDNSDKGNTNYSACTVAILHMDDENWKEKKYAFYITEFEHIYSR